MSKSSSRLKFGMVVFVIVAGLDFWLGPGDGAFSRLASSCLFGAVAGVTLGWLSSIREGFSTKLTLGMIIGAAAAAFFYWTSDSGIRFSRGETSYYLGILFGVAATWWYHTQDRPRRMIAEFDEVAGYWRLRLAEDCVCFATSEEREKIPEPDRGSPERVSTFVGRIHCIVKDEFYVWREHFGPPLSDYSSQSDDDLYY